MCTNVEDAGGGLQPQQCLSESVGSEVVRRPHLGAASQGDARDEEDNGEQCESVHPEILRRDSAARSGSSYQQHGPAETNEDTEKHGPWKL